MPKTTALFRSFFAGGFECSTQIRRDGRRLDLLAATKHDLLAAGDYERLTRAGIHTIRDGLRWHLIERVAGQYDWSSFLPMLQSAERAQVEVIWDLCHYGCPDDVDIWSAGFIDRFAAYAAAAATVIANETDSIPRYCLINEISFWAWAACCARIVQPAVGGRAMELKRQLVRATIAATEAVRAVDPRARLINADPMVAVAPKGKSARSRAAAENYHLAQHEARDMLIGTLEPDLGGAPEYLDILGVNYYPNNQWVLGGRTIEFGNPNYQPMRNLLVETYNRYHRPIFVSETGAEGSARAAWLHYVCDEVRAAMAAGVPIAGICLYPIVDYPGWQNGRNCEVGLFGNAHGLGDRPKYQPLADELVRQQFLMNEQRAERRHMV